MPWSFNRRQLLAAAIALAAAMPVDAQVVTVRGTANGLPIPPVCQPPTNAPVSFLFTGGVLTATYVCDTTATPPALAVSCQPSGLGGPSSPITVQYDVRPTSEVSEIFIDCPTAPTTTITNLDVELIRYYPDLNAYENGGTPASLACRRAGVPTPGTVSNPSYDPLTRILRYTCTVSGTPTEVGCFTWERNVPRALLGGDSRLSYASDNYTLRAPDCIGFGTPVNWAANAPVVVSGVLFADGFEVEAGATTTTITGFDPNPGVAGQPYTVNVSVASPFGRPSGAVLVSDGTGGNCVAMLNSNNPPTGSCQLPGPAPGNRTVQATYVGTADFLGSTTSAQYTVPRGTQTIVWNEPLSNPNPLVYSNGGTATLTATVQLSPPGSGGTLTYTVNAGSTACTVSGNTLTIVAATHNADGSAPLTGGPTCVITANVSGNASYDPATPVTRTIAIRQAPQPITFNPPDPLPRFDPNGTFTVQATRSANSAGQPLTFFSDSPSICTISGAPSAAGHVFTQTIQMTNTRGTCALRVFQSTGGNPNFVTGQASTSFQIQPGLQNLIYSGPSQVVYTPSGTFQVTVTGGKSSQQIMLLTPLPACSISGTPTHSVLGDGRRRVVATIAMNQIGMCSILADQQGDADFLPATQEFFVNIVP